MQKKILYIDTNLKPSLKLIDSLEDIPDLLGSNGMVYQSTFFIPDLGVIQYADNSFFNSGEQNIHIDTDNLIVKSFDLPCVLYLNSIVNTLEDMNYSVAFKIASHLSLPLISFDPEEYIDEENEFVCNRMKVSKDRKHNITAINNLFIGKNDSFIGESSMTLFNSEEYSFEGELQKNNSSEIFNSLNLLNSFEFYPSRKDYFNEIYRVKETSSITLEADKLWGNICIINNLKIIPLYNKNMIQTCLSELIDDLIHEFNIDCFVISLDNTEIFLDYYEDLSNQIIQSSKEFILQENGFKKSSNSSFVYYHLNTLEENFLEPVLKQENLLSSLYGTYEEYILKGRPNVIRTFIRYNYLKKDINSVIHAFHMAIYHQDLDLIQTLKDLPIYKESILGLNAINIVILNDSVDVLAYFYECGIITSVDIHEIMQLVIKHDAPQCLYWGVNLFSEDVYADNERLRVNL